jgi:hypothetical protein
MIRQQHDVEALRLERDRRWDAGETIREINEDFRARGIDPRILSPEERPRTVATAPAAADAHSAGDRGAAAPGGPTEAEIRELVDDDVRRWPKDNFTTPLNDAIEAAFGIIEYTVDGVEEVISHVWADLTAEQREDLEGCILAGRIRAIEAARPVIVDAVVAAAMAFGAAHPDAKRAPAELVR